MEKILNIIKKFIFSIPFLLICFSIKHVYAEDLDIYVNLRPLSSNGILFYSSSNVPSSQINRYSTNYKINLYNTNFNFNYNLNNNTNYNSFIFYDSEKNVYLFLNYIVVNSSSYTFANSSYNILCDDDNLPSVLVKNGSNMWFNPTNNLYSRHYLFSNNEIDNDFYLNVFTSDTDKNSFNLDNYYINSNRYEQYQKQFNKYICNNYQNLKLVYKYKDDIYINNIKQEIYSGSDDPEEPTIPPYNFNNNKYYVPNYHEGQCVEVIDKDTIRVFDDEFTSFYTDYYINSNYISKTGQVDLDYEKNCSTLQFTDIRYYGNDLPQILFILFLILLFTIGFPYVLFKRFRKR